MIKLTEILLEILTEDRCKRIADRKYDKPSAYKSGAIVRCRDGKIWKDLKEKESLHKWFKRQGAPGKTGGWVDCNTCRTVDGKKKCKSCGRQKGESRSKYPSCRPTPSQCSRPGKGKKWGKTNEASNPQSGKAAPYGSGYAPIKELVTGTEVICDNCGWNWKIKDGGDDLYICHKCNHDNTPEQLN